jgi:hypothetical protein
LHHLLDAYTELIEAERNRKLVKLKYATHKKSSLYIVNQSTQSALPTNTPLPKMASIHNTVSAIRSQIFNTIHNPTSARTGAKYLRKPLRGAAITKYYPKLPKLATLNSQLHNNKYANWSLAGPSNEAITSPAAATETATGAEVEVEAEAEAGSSGRSVARQLRTGEEITGLEYTEVERREGAGWLQDEKERVRLMESNLRHKLGKGPPKKGTFIFLSLISFSLMEMEINGPIVDSADCIGQGRRSQMKKK